MKVTHCACTLDHVELLASFVDNDCRTSVTAARPANLCDFEKGEEEDYVFITEQVGVGRSRPDWEQDEEHASTFRERPRT